MLSTNWWLTCFVALINVLSIWSLSNWGQFLCLICFPYVPSSFYFTKVTDLVFNTPARFLWVRTCSKDWDASGCGRKWRTQSCWRGKLSQSRVGSQEGVVFTLRGTWTWETSCWHAGLFLSKSGEAVLLHAPNQLPWLRTTPRDINSPAMPHYHVIAKEDTGCPGNSCKDMRCQSGELWGRDVQRKTIRWCEQALCISSGYQENEPCWPVAVAHSTWWPRLSLGLCSLQLCLPIELFCFVYPSDFFNYQDTWITLGLLIINFLMFGHSYYACHIWLCAKKILETGLHCVSLTLLELGM